MSRGDTHEGAERVALSGVQTLIRLFELRYQLDLETGLNTATLISGYPGSPLGGVDLLLEQQREQLMRSQVLHRPGVNEELALAAVWGSQMGAAFEYAGVDGVVGAWYGKTPGLDRSGDVLRHANAQGSGPNGGLVLFCGDDPTAKSSTLPCESQYAFQDACVPVLYPADQQDLLELGVHAFALSRHAGPLVGVKIVTSVADGVGSVGVARERYRIRPITELRVNGQPWRHTPLATIGPHRIPEQEQLMVEQRLLAGRAYVRQQGLDRVQGAGPGARLGIVTAGKAYRDVLQAFLELGVTPESAGVRVLKLAMTFPLVDETVLELARSVEQLLVIEEKRPFIETQLRAVLHEAGCAVPASGKRDRQGQPLVAATGELDAAQVAGVLTRVLPDLAARTRPRPRVSLPALVVPARPPAYCSGCPHNRSTVVPGDAIVGGGIGCHGMVYFEPRQRELRKLPPPPMGAEGVPWIGLAPFVREPHLIQSIGDGTLSHSGILAIRSSVAAGVNITFKILYNAAVAMTGGQPVAGLMDVPALTRALDAEGVKRIVVCAEDPAHYGPAPRWASGVEVTDRDRLQEIQAALRAVPGVSVIIYDQRCAAEARRLRRRGLLSTPPARVVINEAVCEGCGDCQTKSNCASVVTHHTDLGEKRKVDDLTCNRDYTCMEGDCPSFVTITPLHDEATKKLPRKAARVALPPGELPLPARAELRGAFGVYITGIGGTGVITAGRILSGAAEAAGLYVSGMDQTGLAQRGGAVVSHLQFAADPGALGAAAIGDARADLYLSGDILQAADAKHLAKVDSGRTVAAIDRELTPTSAMRQTGQPAPELPALEQRIRDSVGEGRAALVDSQRIASLVFAEHVLANVVLLGAAFQLGGLPFSLADVQAALGQRGSGAAANREAFEWGRWVVHDPRAVEAALAAADGDGLTTAAYSATPRSRAQASALVGERSLPEALQPLLLRRTAHVIDYQGPALARRYLDLCARAALRDSAAHGWELTRAVAESWFKLLTYKDEYEVARLHAATNYDAIARQLGIEGPYQVKYHLHPPSLRRLGAKHKLPLGWPYALGFAALRRMKWLRGTPLDPFGWDADRRLERGLILEYQALMDDVLTDRERPYALQVQLAASAQDIKGYAGIKERAAEAWRARVRELTAPRPALTAGAAP